jgi:hypothetical protein
LQSSVFVQGHLEAKGTAGPGKSFDLLRHASRFGFFCAALPNTLGPGVSVIVSSLRTGIGVELHGIAGVVDGYRVAEGDLELDEQRPRSHQAGASYKFADGCRRLALQPAAGFPSCGTSPPTPWWSLVSNTKHNTVQ